MLYALITNLTCFYHHFQQLKSLNLVVPYQFDTRKEIELLNRKKLNSRLSIDKGEVVISNDIYGETVVGSNVYKSIGEYRLRSEDVLEPLFPIPNEVMKFELEERSVLNLFYVILY